MSTGCSLRRPANDAGVESAPIWPFERRSERHSLGSSPRWALGRRDEHRLLGEHGLPVEAMARAPAGHTPPRMAWERSSRRAVLARDRTRSPRPGPPSDGATDVGAELEALVRLGTRPVPEFAANPDRFIGPAHRDSLREPEPTQSVDREMHVEALRLVRAGRDACHLSRRRHRRPPGLTGRRAGA
jgi:hypothetical protein